MEVHRTANFCRLVFGRQLSPENPQARINATEGEVSVQQPSGTDSCDASIAFNSYAIQLGSGGEMGGRLANLDGVYHLSANMLSGLGLC